MKQDILWATRTKEGMWTDRHGDLYLPQPLNFVCKDSKIAEAGS